MRTTALILAIVAALGLPWPAAACVTCGCSEICPVAMVESGAGGRSTSVLTDSIWGNMILKMVYDRDPQLNRLLRRSRLASNAALGMIGGTAGATIAQNTVSLATLNPPDGIEDSYVPGAIGLAISGAVNVLFPTRMLINYSYRRKIRARQLVLRARVERVLGELEDSLSNCPEARAQLSRLVGDRAALECVELWRSSHASTAMAAPPAPPGH